MIFYAKYIADIQRIEKNPHFLLKKTTFQENNERKLSIPLSKILMNFNF
jgi:hypothetical protein